MSLVDKVSLEFMDLERVAWLELTIGPVVTHTDPVVTDAEKKPEGDRGLKLPFTGILVDPLTNTFHVVDHVRILQQY